MNWFVEMNSETVRFRGEVADKSELSKVIAALSAQMPLLAQGIEAGTATTEGRGPKDESPVANGDAPIT